MAAKTNNHPSLDEVMDAAEDDMGCRGFCLACGEEADGCEPDARKYECDCCGEHQVYGAAEILLMGAYNE